MKRSHLDIAQLYSFIRVKIIIYYLFRGTIQWTPMHTKVTFILPGALGGFGNATISALGILSLSVRISHSGVVVSLYWPSLVAIAVTLPLSFLRYTSNSLSWVIDLPDICTWPGIPNLLQTHPHKKLRMSHDSLLTFLLDCSYVYSPEWCSCSMASLHKLAAQSSGNAGQGGSA